MPTYHLTYTGGSTPDNEEAAAAVMEAWNGWFADLGDAIVDGGHPLGPVQSIAPGGAVRDGGEVTGYSIIAADDLADAVAKAKGCPVLTDGGAVEVGECVDM
jgi:hypothetical protein